jgi:hypothetical protein
MTKNLNGRQVVFRVHYDTHGLWRQALERLVNDLA